MLIFKYICAIIALLSTLIFISNIITSLSTPSWVDKENDKSGNYAALRLILALIMSITWPILFLF